MSFSSRPQDLFVLGEDVEGQRLFSSVDELDGFVQAAHWQDGQQRAKYLLLHHLCLWLHVLQDCRGWKSHTK